VERVTDNRTLAAFEMALAGHTEERYVLRLYVTGTTRNSARAIQHVRKVCEAHLPGRYDLEVIDIYQQPALAQAAQLIGAPTLVKEQPPPVRKLIGDLSNEPQVLAGLDLYLA
jgi:circadian clock protein KaiB